MLLFVILDIVKSVLKISFGCVNKKEGHIGDDIDLDDPYTFVSHRTR